jgi:nrdI protein
LVVLSTSVDTEELKSTDNTDSGSKDHVVMLSSLPEGPRVVYFSSSTENTRRFVDKVGIPSVRLPVVRKDPPVKGDAPYVLIVPSYGGGRMEPKHAIPKQVMTFLKDPESRDNCVGVISSGNMNFGEAYLIAGKLLSEKLKVPFLYGFELLGTPTDVDRVREGITSQWDTLVRNRVSTID